MKKQLKDLPGAAKDGGYVYALAFANGFVKVGKSVNPASRVAVHAHNAGRFGIEMTDWWVSSSHDGYEDTERTLIAIAAALSGDPSQFARNTEHFTGVDFGELVKLAGQLDTNPTDGTRARPVAVQSGAGTRKPASDTSRTPAKRATAAAFSALIVGARHSLGLTQDKVVHATGISKTTLIRWEAGRAERPEPERVRALCLLLGINPVDAVIALGFLTESDVMSGLVAA